MPHLKCEACRIRFHTDDHGLSGALCPECSAPLEPPSRLTALVGFQRARLDGLPRDDSDFLAAVAMALTPPGPER
jgi:hypothetical protein